MSLLTPPNTSHRRRKDKENIHDASLNANSRVAWAEIDEIRILQLAPLPNVSTGSSASKRPPAKSILKKADPTLLAPWPQEKKREVTPEPADPLVNLTYLGYPVSTIVQATGVTVLKDLIEAYSILLARLRASVTGATDADASWPLFQPLRKHREAFVNAVVRDLGRALVDPATVDKQVEEPPPRVLLPSPKNTPNKKKRDGMTGEQVKFARDLCTTSHAVIRLLSLVFTFPAIMNVFTDAQLREMFTGVLAIPLSDNLPTPNARKTWALAIWLIQTQRLSANVLAPAADRIALALCRGIEGELGKEGKKGSASDGLKAIHDLSIHLPDIFIPAFTHSALPSVLSMLVAPTLALRTNAAHALGGFAFGATSMPTSECHTRISQAVSKFITTPSRPTLLSPTKIGTVSPTKIAVPSQPSSSSPNKQPKPNPPLSPTKPQDSSIIRTLRTVLQATDPVNVAHGPVWGTCVLSALLALLGPTAMNPEHAQIRLLMQLGLKHKNRAVRGLTAIMWRVVIWVGMQPALPISDDSEAESDEEEEVGVEKVKEERLMKAREEWWRLATSVVEFETGVCAIAAYIGSTNVGVPMYEVPKYRFTKADAEEEEEKPLRCALEVLYAMVCKDTPTRGSAIDTLKQLVTPPPSPTDKASETEGEKRTLLPRALFSALPGFLSTDFAVLKNVINPVWDETPKAEDVRPLTSDELKKVWVWEGVVRAWKAAVGAISKGEEGEKEKDDLVRIWEGLVAMGLAAVLEDADENADPDSESSHNQDAVAEFTLRAVDIIITDVLEDASIQLTAASQAVSNSRCGLDIPGFTSITLSCAMAKLAFARDLWGVLSRTVPHLMLGAAAERLAACLIRNAEEYTTLTGRGDEDIALEDEGENVKELNEAWAEFCVSVLGVCDSESMYVFWGQDYEGSDAGTKNTDQTAISRWNATERAMVWRVFVKGWMEQGSAAGWEAGASILAVPFIGQKAGQLWTTTEDDAVVWHQLLERSVAVALDYGHDSSAVLNVIVNLLTRQEYSLEHIRLAEFFLTYVDGIARTGDLRELAEPVFDFISRTMVSAYPPSKDQTTYTWVARAVSALVEHCPRELMCILGERLAEAVAVWVGDADGKWDCGVIEYDIIPLYQTFIITIQGFPTSPSLVKAFGPVLSAPLGTEVRIEIRQPALETFRDFWDTSYADVHAPKRGWGEEVEACLYAVYGASEDEATLIAKDNKAEENPRVELQQAFVLRPSTPTPSSPTVIPETPATASWSSCSTSSTVNTLFTPPPLHVYKPTRLFAQLPTHPPESPMQHTSRLTVFARPPTPKTSRGSPTKRRKLASGNKENKSPMYSMASPPAFGRILEPLKGGAKIALGKRRFEDDVPDSEDERNSVESLIVPTDEDDVFLVPVSCRHITSVKFDSTATIITSKKRKRMILDAVEVPPLSETFSRRLRSSKSLDSTTVCTPSKTLKTVRKTRSDTKVWDGHMDGSSASRLKKRRKGSSHSVGQGSEVFSTGSVLLQALVSQQPFKRGQHRLPSSEISSDDDPHIGQVTPHHLISPEPKRGRGVDVDPPSDDSVMAPSPSRDMVQRRLQRLGSNSNIIEVKAFFV